MNLLEWLYKRIVDAGYCDPLGVELSEDGKFVFRPCATDEEVDEAEAKGAFVKFSSGPEGYHRIGIVNGQLHAEAVETLRNEVLNTVLKTGLDRQGELKIVTMTREGGVSGSILSQDTITIK